MHHLHTLTTDLCVTQGSAPDSTAILWGNVGRASASARESEHQHHLAWALSTSIACSHRPCAMPARDLAMEEGKDAGKPTPVCPAWLGLVWCQPGCAKAGYWTCSTDPQAQRRWGHADHMDILCGAGPWARCTILLPQLECKAIGSATESTGQPSPARRWGRGCLYSAQRKDPVQLGLERKHTMGLKGSTAPLPSPAPVAGWA